MTDEKNTAEPEAEAEAEAEAPSTPKLPEGDAEVRISLNPISDQVIVNFGRLIEWIGMRPDQAKQFAKILWQKAVELEQANRRAKVIPLDLKKKKKEHESS